jgi:hypothetical protein
MVTSTHLSWSQPSILFTNIIYTPNKFKRSVLTLLGSGRQTRMKLTSADCTV